MNYRHAFHAGNAGDCLKHALLVWLLGALARKPAGFAVLDTHAGIGSYDLGVRSQTRAGGRPAPSVAAADADSRLGQLRPGFPQAAPYDAPDDVCGRTRTAGADAREPAGRNPAERTPAERTGEWRDGIARVLTANEPALADYTGLVRHLGLYPGSPAIARALLRPQDRLICCELHPEDAAVLRRRFRNDPQVSVHERDGYAAVGALLPPAERRGLVLIDPPYERADEFARILTALRTGQRRFPGGVFAIWYPLKGGAAVRAFHDALRASTLPDLTCAELHLAATLDAGRLSGSGMILCRAPFRFADEAAPLLDALRRVLGAGADGGGTAITRLTDERGAPCRV